MKQFIESNNKLYDNTCHYLGNITTIKNKCVVNDTFLNNLNEIGLEVDELILLAQKVKFECKYTVYGIDVIVENNKKYVIDLNYFPSFKDVENGIELLHQDIIDKLNCHLKI